MHPSRVSSPAPGRFVSVLGAALAAAFLLTAVPRPVAAQNVNDAFTPFAAAFDLRELASDGAGHLWIASGGGALRFDVATQGWTQFLKGLGTGPRGNDLVTVAVDALGRIWVGSATRGFTFYDPVTHRWDRDSEEWPDPHIRVIRTFGSGVYIGTQNGLSLKPTANRTDICNDSDPSCDVPSYGVNDYALLGDTLWVATQKGLGRFNGSFWDSAAALPPGSVGSASLSLAVHQGVLWEATAGDVRRLVGGAWETFPLTVNRLVETGGGLYAVADTQVWAWNGTDWAAFPVPLGAGTTIRDLCAVGGDLYFALSSGLGRMRLGQSQLDRFYPPGPGLVGVFSGITVDRSGVMWAGTSEMRIGVLSYDGAAWSLIEPSTGGLRSQWIFDVEADPVGAIWVAHCCCPVPADCPLQIADASGFRTLNILNALVVLPDAAGRMWVGTDRFGVLVLERNPDDGSWNQLFNLTSASTGGSLANDNITALAVTPDGTYIGHGSAGVDYWPNGGNLDSGRNGQGWIHIGEGGFGLLDTNVGAMVANGEDVWVGTSGGLHRFRKGVLLERCPTKDRRVSSDLARKVNAMVVDALGGLWVATDNGLLYLRRGSECTVDGADFAVFDESNSPLPHNRVRAAAVSPTDGSVWMGTASGLLRIDPALYTGSTPPPDRYVLYPNPLDLRPDARPARRTVIFGVDVGGVNVAPASPDAVFQPEVFDLAGQRVGTFTRRSSPGTGSWIWDGANTAGHFVVPGVYIVRARTSGGDVVVRKLGVLR